MTTYEHRTPSPTELGVCRWGRLGPTSTAPRGRRGTNCWILPRAVLAVMATGWVAVSGPVRSESVESFTEPVKSIDVAASEVGVLTSVKVKQGEQVVVGELLAELDIDVLQSTLAIAQAKAAATGAVEAARAERDLKLKRLTQLEKLMARGHATTGELARARTDLAIAEARVRMTEEETLMAQLECKRIQSQIERRKIRSPITGLVSEVYLDVGEAFMPTDPRIVTLVDLSSLRVRFQVLPQQALQFEPDQIVTLDMPDVDRKVSGRVERISPVMDSKSGTVEVAVLIDNQPQKLRSGTRCIIHPDGSPGSSLTRPYPTRSVTRDR